MLMRHPSLVDRSESALTPTIGMGPIGLQALTFRDVYKDNYGIAELVIGISCVTLDDSWITDCKHLLLVHL